MAVLVAMVSTAIFILTFAVILAKSNFKELFAMHRKWKKKHDVVVRTINEYIKNGWQHAGSYAG